MALGVAAAVAVVVVARMGRQIGIGIVLVAVVPTAAPGMTEMCHLPLLLPLLAIALIAP
jgi:hypothetical protein